MKYAIENLFKSTDILCHEVRVHNHANESYLLHFIICQDRDDTNPYFALGYEHYINLTDPLSDSNNDINLEKDYKSELGINQIRPLQRQYSEGFSSDYIETSETPLYTELGYLKSYGLINQNDSLSTLFEDNVNKHISSYDENYNLESDNPYYSIDKSTSEKIKTKELEKTHSIFRSDIHLDKEKEVNKTELIHLLESYKPYLGKELTSNIEKESDFNIDMEKIFGISFDWERVKMDWFGKNKVSSYKKELIDE